MPACYSVSLEKQWFKLSTGVTVSEIEEKYPWTKTLPQTSDFLLEIKIYCSLNYARAPWPWEKTWKMQRVENGFHHTFHIEVLVIH